MPDSQGKGRGEDAVEKHTSRPNEQGGAGGTKAGGQKTDKTVEDIRKQTRGDIGKTLGK